METKSRKIRQLETIYTLILYFFSIEYVGSDGISVFRVLIFPLTLIGVFLTSSELKSKNYSSIILFVFCFLAWDFISNIITEGNPLSPIFTFPLLLLVVGVWSNRQWLDVDYVKIFIWYSVPHYLAVLLGLEYMHETRFCGLHNDPNFCGMFLSISITASIILLLRKNIKIKWKLVYLANAFLSLVLLFATGSRGAMLSMTLLIFFFFLTSRISRFKKIIVLALLSIAVIQIWNYILTLPVWVNPEEDPIGGVLSRFNPENMEGGSGRTDIWSMVIGKLADSNYLIPIGLAEAMKGQTNAYVHNTFLEILVQDGVIFGSIFLLVVIVEYIKAILYEIKIGFHGYDSDLFYVIFVILSQMIFISAGIKIFWFLVFTLFCMNKFYKLYGKSFAHNTSL